MTDRLPPSGPTGHARRSRVRRLLHLPGRGRGAGGGAPGGVRGGVRCDGGAVGRLRTPPGLPGTPRVRGLAGPERRAGRGRSRVDGQLRGLGRLLRDDRRGPAHPVRLHGRGPRLLRLLRGTVPGTGPAGTCGPGGDRTGRVPSIRVRPLAAVLREPVLADTARIHALGARGCTDMRLRRVGATGHDDPAPGTERPPLRSGPAAVGDARHVDPVGELGQLDGQRGHRVLVEPIVPGLDKVQPPTTHRTQQLAHIGGSNLQGPPVIDDQRQSNFAVHTRDRSCAALTHPAKP